MSAKHTPVPWINQKYSDGEIVITAGKQGFIIAEVTNYNQVGALQKGEDEANAKLIAAAPELLEALQMYLRDTTPALNNMITHNAALKAVTKATI